MFGLFFCSCLSNAYSLTYITSIADLLSTADNNENADVMGTVSPVTFGNTEMSLWYVRP